MLYEIGRWAFGFALVYAIVTTVLYIAVMYAGLDPGPLARYSFGADYFYSLAARMAEHVPTGNYPLSWLVQGAWLVIVGFGALFATLVGLIITLSTAFIQFGLMMSDYIPPIFGFMKPIILFVSSFLQLALLYYAITTIRNWIAGASFGGW